MTERDLQGQVALVTGGARGIGRACARKLAAHGATVVGVDLDGATMEAAADALRKEGLSVDARQADISDAAQVSALMKEVFSSYGQVDILVNNAGIIDDTPIDRMDLERWRRVMDVNLLGSQLCTAACVGQMVERHYGRLVFVSSRAGQMGSPLVNPSYSASKAALICLSKSYAHYVAPYGVVSNAVAPAFIQTEMVRGGGQPEDLPMKRLGTPEEIANVVYFLSSGLCSYVNGVTIEANGGQYIR